MFRLGIIAELGEGENLGYARVSFDDDDFVSGWLALPSTNTRTAKQWIPVEVNSQVACHLDDLCEQGYIAAVLWSTADTPPKWASPDTIGILFADGAEFYYDAKVHTLTINAPDSEVNITCAKLNVTGEVNIKGETSIEGDTSVTGEVTATVEVTAGAQKIALTKHKHPTPAGVSGPPTP